MTFSFTGITGWVVLGLVAAFLIAGIFHPSLFSWLFSILFSLSR